MTDKDLGNFDINNEVYNEVFGIVTICNLEKVLENLVLERKS